MLAKVLSPQGEPVGEADIWFISMPSAPDRKAGTEPEAGVTSNKNNRGTFEFGNESEPWPPGQLALMASSEGFADSDPKLVEIAEGSHLEVELRLRPLSSILGVKPVK